jgi:hypothetical protein
VNIGEPVKLSRHAVPTFRKFVFDNCTVQLLCAAIEVQAGVELIYGSQQQIELRPPL